MNKYLNYFGHTAASAAVTIAGIYAGLGIWPGLIISFGWVFREVTQAEYRWIAKYGQGKRKNMPWWGGLDLRVWKYDALVNDLALPFVVTFGLWWWLV